MSLLPSSTLLTNELKLYDFKGTKASITFGDTDINDGYSYLKINYRANDYKFDFWQDKPIFNIIAEKDFTFNDKKIWREDNDGPMSGLNADMLDGLHASEFKDRNGHYHFGHAFKPGGEKMFVKIATFTPRRVGNAPDFNTDGTPPYQGIFADNIVKRMDARAKFHTFVDDTPKQLGKTGINGFEHTDMASEGVYNATLRASISLLRKGIQFAGTAPETIDVHVGIFEDPTNQNDDGWASTSRYFYISSHENSVPFLKEKDNPNHVINDNGNVHPIPTARSTKDIKPNNKNDKDVVTKDKINTKVTNDKSKASSTHPTYENHTCHRPVVDDTYYITPPDPSKNNFIPEEFPPIYEPGYGYQKDIDAFRLYHVDSNVGMIDGVKIVTHKFDLYMVVDSKAEVRIQPYMSSSCLFYNYQKPIPESELPDTNYMNPSSVYDNRYAHVEHRHAGYEAKMEEIDREIADVWDCFDNYVAIDQGWHNSNKILMTNQDGKVVAIENNMELHEDYRRTGERVMVSDKSKCITESTITTKELAQLDGIRGNIQDQIDGVTDELDDMSGKFGDYVKKTGDTMTGDLVMKNNAEVKVYGNHKDEDKQFGAHFHANNGYAGLHDPYENSPAYGMDCISTKYLERSFFIQKKFFTIGGLRSNGAPMIIVQPDKPTNAKVGDVWIKIPAPKYTREIESEEDYASVVAELYGVDENEQ